MVPATAGDPCVFRQGCGVGLDFGLHGGQGGDVVEIDGEVLLAGEGDVGVGVVEAGHDEGAVEVDLCGGGAVIEDLGVGADVLDTAVQDSEGGDALGLVGLKTFAGEDVAVVVDDIEGRAALCVGEGRGEQESKGEGFHVVSVARE